MITFLSNKKNTLYVQSVILESTIRKIIKRSVGTNAIASVSKKLFRTSGFIDLGPSLRTLLNNNNVTPEALNFKKTLSFYMLFYGFTMFRHPIGSIYELHQRTGKLLTSRPFVQQPFFVYPKNHRHGLEIHMPFIQNALATSFAGYGLDYLALPKTITNFDATYYNTSNKTPLPVTFLGEIFLIENTHGDLITKDPIMGQPRVEGFLINPDNILNSSNQGLFHTLCKQPNPDACFYIVFTNGRETKIICIDVKLIQDPEKYLSWTKGYIAVSPYLDYNYAMKRATGDINGNRTQAVNNNKFIEESLENKAINKWVNIDLKEILVNKQFNDMQKYDKFILKNKEAMLNSNIRTIVPSIILGATTHSEFLNYFENNSDEITQQILDEITQNINYDILFPISKQINRDDADKMFIDIFSKFPKEIRIEIIDNYLACKRLLIKI